MKGTTQGEIVQVDGGHILRATGRKDRHSKVYTAKGPRDRRVRLSAHTAIQFYDVQDRLGYDRPSKAVDWLIKKAKTAIDKLNEVAPPDSNSDLALDQHHQSEGVCGYELIHPNNNDSSSSNNNNNSSSFMVASGEPDLMNTMKSFFPSFGNDPCESSSFQAEDLGLSLQTFHADNSNLPFQESFQRIGGWNGDHRVGVVLNSQQPIFSFAHREHLQSNAPLNPWNHHILQPLTSKSSNFETPFDLGFRVPARIYGDEEADNHR